MRSVKSWVWVLAVLVVAFIIAGITWLVVGQLVSRKLAFGGLLFTFLVIVAATLADWFTRDGRGLEKTWKDRLSNPNWLARVGMSAFFGLGAGLFVQQFISPTDTDILEGLLNSIQAGQKETNTKLGEIAAQTAPKPWRGFDQISGLWGEERTDCRFVYRFERNELGLTITAVRGIEALGAYRMTASITPDGTGDIVRATLRTSTEADEAHGQALVFTYHDDGGGYRRLDWLNETRSNAGVVKLEPCGEAS